MECRYCRAWNDEEEHRCGRCGRRLKPSVARPAPETYPIATATAPALEVREPVAKVAEFPPPPQTGPQRAAYQRALFHEMQRVVEMPSNAPAEPRRARAQRTPRSRRAVEGQQSLEFHTLVDTQVEAVIYCDAPVALPAHRFMASLLDGSLIVSGLGLFLATFLLAGGEVMITRHTIALFAGIAAVLGLFYHFLFCIGGGDTAGMQWTQLRLVNFDGETPDREQRFYRLVGSCLSFLAAGLGLMWALVDEESLTWHDHMSKTFPSPHQPEDTV